MSNPEFNPTNPIEGTHDSPSRRDYVERGMEFICNMIPAPSDIDKSVLSQWNVCMKQWMGLLSDNNFIMFFKSMNKQIVDHFDNNTEIGEFRTVIGGRLDEMDNQQKTAHLELQNVKKKMVPLWYCHHVFFILRLFFMHAMDEAKFVPRLRLNALTVVELSLIHI